MALKTAALWGISLRGTATFFLSRLHSVSDLDTNVSIISDLSGWDPLDEVLKQISVLILFCFDTRQSYGSVLWVVWYYYEGVKKDGFHFTTRVKRKVSRWVSKQNDPVEYFYLLLHRSPIKLQSNCHRLAQQVTIQISINESIQTTFCLTKLESLHQPKCFTIEEF